MSRLSTYLELNDIFLTLQRWSVDEINALYDDQWANYTYRIETLFADIWVAPIKMDSVDFFHEFLDYTIFTKPASFDECSKPVRQREYNYMLPYPNDFEILLELITELAFSPKEFSVEDLRLLNWIIEFIHRKIKRKDKLDWYSKFVWAIEKIFPVIEWNFQKFDRTQSQALYSLRDLVYSKKFETKKKDHRFLRDSIDDILMSYGIIDLYLEFSKNDFVHIVGSENLLLESSENANDFENVQQWIILWINMLILDIKTYIYSTKNQSNGISYISNLVCRLLHHFHSMKTRFDQATKCRNVILYKLTKLFFSLGLKKSDYLDYLQTTQINA